MDWRTARYIDFLVVLMDAHLSGVTLRQANETRLIHSDTEDPQVYDGRIERLGALRQKYVKSYPGGRMEKTNFNISLSNLPDIDLDNWTFNQYLPNGVSEKTWIKKAFKFYAADNRTLKENFLKFFTGYVAKKNGLDYGNRKLDLNLVDRREFDDVELGIKPLESYSDATNPPDDQRGQPLSTVFGDWSSAKNSYQPIEGLYLTTPSEILPVGTLKLSEYGMSAIEDGSNKAMLVRQDGTVSYHTVVVDNLSEAKVVVTFSGKYLPGDRCFFYGKGLPEVGASTTVATNPGKVFESILYYICGVSNVESLADLITQTNEFEVRRIVDKKTTALEILYELARETNFDIDVTAEDNYRGLFFQPSLDVVPSDPIFNHDDILIDSYDIENDKGGFFINEVVCRYGYEPNYHIDDEGSSSYARESKWTRGDEIVQSGYQGDEGVLRESIDFHWLYLNANALSAMQRMLLFRRRALETINLSVWGGLDLNLGDAIILNFDKHEDEKVQIREINRNFETGKTDLVLWNNSVLSFVGKWTSDSSPDWSPDLTSEELEDSGFWMPEWKLITSRVNKIYFREYSPTTAVLEAEFTAGFYATLEQVLNTIAAKMTEVSGTLGNSRTYSIDYDVTNPKKITISADGDFSLNWQTGSEAIVAQRLGRELLGYDVETDSGTSSTHLSKYIAFKSEGDDVSNWS